MGLMTLMENVTVFEKGSMILMEQKLAPKMAKLILTEQEKE